MNESIDVVVGRQMRAVESLRATEFWPTNGDDPEFRKRYEEWVKNHPCEVDASQCEPQHRQDAHPASTSEQRPGAR